MTIECIKFSSHSNGTLIGFADLWIPRMGLEIYGCTLMKKDGKRWLNLPSREYVDRATGEKRFSKVLYFRGKEHSRLFGEAAKKAIDKWCAENSIQNVRPQAAQP